MTALEWIRSKAQQVEVDTFTTDEGQTIRATRFSFRGRLPARMVFQAREQYSQLVSNDTENETLRVGGEYRSDFGKCEYFRSVYEMVAQ